MTATPAGPVIQALRDATPVALAALLRRGTPFGDAEDAVQDAATMALDSWTRSGLPDRPIGWLVRVAQRRLIAAHRSDTARRRREELVAAWSARPAEPEPEPAADDQLALLFLCCHPALSAGSAIALTLRAVGGLSTAAIAEALLQPEATVAQRISRAKAAITRSAEPFRRPPPDLIDARLPTVMQIVYLIFNEGHAAARGLRLDRPDLAADAIGLARQLHAQLPDQPEAGGLLALLLLTHARRAARIDAAGELVPLDRQDRRLWDRALITEGLTILSAAFAHHNLGVYQLQAAVAAVHDEAPTYADTAWAKLRALYDVLARRTDNPVVLLNRAVAVAHTSGPEIARAELDPLAERLAGHHRFHATIGYLAELAGDQMAARQAYSRAAERAGNGPERRYLLRRAGL